LKLSQPHTSTGHFEALFVKKNDVAGSIRM